MLSRRVLGLEGCRRCPGLLLDIFLKVWCVSGGEKYAININSLNIRVCVLSALKCTRLLSVPLRFWFMIRISSLWNHAFISYLLTRFTSRLSYILEGTSVLVCVRVTFIETVLHLSSRCQRVLRWTSWIQMLVEADFKWPEQVSSLVLNLLETEKQTQLEAFLQTTTPPLMADHQSMRQSTCGVCGTTWHEMPCLVKLITGI